MKLTAKRTKTGKAGRQMFDFALFALFVVQLQR
jgi:hypothetical protein